MHKILRQQALWKPILEEAVQVYESISDNIIVVEERREKR